MLSRRGIHHRLSPLALALSLAGVAGGAWAHSDEADDGGHLIPHQTASFNIDGGMTWYLQGADGNDNGKGDGIDLTYTLDLNIEAPVSEHGKVAIALEAGDGSGVDGRLGSLSTANYDAFITTLSNQDTEATFNSFSISQAYYEGEYAGGDLIVDFGKLDVHSLYDDNAYANDETDQFMSAIFTRSPGTSYAELDAYYAPGLALNWAASDMLDLTFVLANGNGAGFDNVGARPYGVVQANIKPVIAGLEGNYRFYVIRDERRYTKISDGSETENTAWGLSFDQALPGELGLFARYSAQDDGIQENQVKSSWSLGLVAEGGRWGREDDVVGIGYGSVNINDDPVVIADMKSNGVGTPDDETHLEVYYKIGFSDHFTLTPDIQVIGNNGGDGDRSTVTVYGLRGQLNF